MLLGTTYVITSILEAEASGEGASPNMKRYFLGARGAQFEDTIIDFAKSGKTITGTYHYYQPTVKLNGKAEANITYCEDQRKGYAKIRKTDEIKTTAPSLKDFALWSLGLAKSSSGDWQVTDYIYKGSAKQCQLS